MEITTAAVRFEPDIGCTGLSESSLSITVARRDSIGARFLPHCRSSMLSIEPSENKVAECEGVSRMGMEGGTLAAIVLGTHTGVFVKRRAAIKPASWENSASSPIKTCVSSY